MSTLITRSTDAASIAPDLVMPFEAEDEASSIVHEILNRSIPDVTLRPASTATGDLRLFFLSQERAEAARVFHRAPAVFAISTDLGWLPATYVPTKIGRAQQEANTLRWIVTIGFRELSVAAPVPIPPPAGLIVDGDGYIVEVPA